MYNNCVSIQDLKGKFKTLFGNTEHLLTLLILVVSLTSFYLGKLSGDTKNALGEPLSEIATGTQSAIVSLATSTKPEGSATEIQDGTGFVASKNGTRYYLPTCSGAQRISPKNKITFRTQADAEAAGYTPASNCKGI